MQKTFCATRFGFQWTDDNWYTFDNQLASKLARKARDEEFKRLKKAGKNPRKFSLGRQLRSFGGIGTDRPHIEVLSNVYGVNADD